MAEAAEAILACVLVRDEARHVTACLATLAWAGHRLVIDSGSTDDTVALAHATGATVLARDWDGWAGQRNFAVAEAARRGYRWILFVDADERVPDDLREEAVRVVTDSDAASARGTKAPVGFWIPRRNVIVGKWIRHAGWDPDFQLRLFRTDRGLYDPTRPVHELVVLDGEAGHLSARLLHLNYDRWSQFWAKQRRYAAAEAGARQTRGQRIRAHNLVLQPWREFWRRYVTLEGWRSGGHGLILSLGMAAAEWATQTDHWRAAAADPAPSGVDAKGAAPTRWERQRTADTPLSRASGGGAGGGGSLHAPVASVPPCDLAVVVVAYDVASLLQECLESVRVAASRAPFRVQAIVVDNASHDDSLAVARRAPGTTVFANPSNMGFGAACNIGFAHARKAGARHVLFLNPDARLDPDALVLLDAAMCAHPRVGLVGPSVVGPDGSPQPARRRFPDVIDLAIESTPLDWRGGDRGRRWPVIGPRMARYRAADLPDVTGNVDWLSGSCILVRAEAFEAVGGFDPTFFLYFEETDLARRLERAGWTRRHVAEASVMHHGSRSASQDLRARDRHYYASKVRYASRYHGIVGEFAVRASHALLFAVEGAWQAIRGDPRASARHFAVARQMARQVDGSRRP